MDNMKEMRTKLDNGNYNLTLEVADSEYFKAYSDVDTAAGEDLVRNYLQNNADDGSFSNVDIRYNKNRHMIKVKTELIYDGNVHKDYKNRGKLM